MKYIVIDEVKYQVDPNDATKALEVDGKKVLYVEETPPAPPEPSVPVPKPDYDKMSDEEVEELAKTDPALARMIIKNRELQENADKTAEDVETARQAELVKNGEFQTIAKEETEKRKAAEEANKEQDIVLGKHKEALREIRDDMLAQIPEDKKTLIPTGSPRSQIDYMRTNAQFLGVSIVKKGSGVPENEDTPPLDEEGKLTKEFTDLTQKENLTQTEKERMGELARLIKTMRARKA